MSDFSLLILATAGFVVTHLGLAGPMRHGLVSRLGEKGYLAVYSLVAFAMLGAMGHFYGAARAAGAAPLWGVNEWTWVPASMAMWIACILFLGSLRGNPALPNPGGIPAYPDRARGVYAITRHPMMWAFAIWGFVHAVVNPTLPSFMLAAGIVIVALAGAAAQDERKALTVGEPFREWKARTAFVPFTRGFDFPDRFSFYGGTLLFLGATLAHKWLANMPAGFWRYLE